MTVSSMPSGVSRGAPIAALVLLLLVVPLLWADPWGLAPWRATGIVLAWSGAGLLLASLVLMVREVRLVQWLGGLDRMMIWHHRTGYGAYVLLLAHPLALALDAWQDAAPRGWQLLSPWTESWPIWLGWASLLVMMAGMASTMLPRLPYGVWRRLHAVLGFGVVLGFVHVLLLGMDAGAVLATAVAAVLLIWRWRRVDSGTAARPYVVRSVQPVAQSLVEIALTPLAMPVRVEPGQFVYVAFFQGPGYHGCGEYHPFTVSSSAAAGQLSLGVKALGDCTRCMQTLQAGVAARVQGPFGDFLAKRPAGPQLWVAGGIGITPFLAALRSEKVLQPVHLLYLFATKADAAFLDELQALALANPLFSLDAHATGEGPADLNTLLPTNAALQGQACYLCGPPGLVASVRRALQLRGIPAQHIHFENFDFR